MARVGMAGQPLLLLFLSCVLERVMVCRGSDSWVMERCRILGGGHWQQGLVGCVVVGRHVSWQTMGKSWSGGGSSSWGSSCPQWGRLRSALLPLPKWGRLGLASQGSNNRAHRWVLWVNVFANKVDSNFANFIANPVTLLDRISKVNSSPKPR